MNCTLVVFFRIHCNYFVSRLSALYWYISHAHLGNCNCDSGFWPIQCPAIRSARLKFKSTNQISATGQNWVFIRHWCLRSVIGCAKQEKLHEVLIESARKIFSMAWSVVFCFVLLILPSSRRSTATISIDRFTASFRFPLNDQYIVIFAAWGSQWRLRRFGRLDSSYNLRTAFVYILVVKYAFQIVLTFRRDWSRRVGTVVFRDTNSRPVSLLGNNEYKSLRVFHVLCLQSSCSTCI